MDITVEIKPDCTASLTAVVPAIDATACRAILVARYASRASIPGFRQGKAPLALVEKRYAKEIGEELSDALFEDVSTEALKQNPNLKVLDFGESNETWGEDGSYHVSSSLIIVPDFQLPEYKGIEITVASDEVSDEEFDEALNDLAKRLAEFKETDRAANDGDMVIIDFTTTLDGKPVAEAVGKPVGFLEGRQDQWMKVEEDGFIPGFGEGLKGLKAGDTKDIEVTLNEQFPVTDLAGKTIVFKTIAKEVREQIIPEFNEALAERIMPGKTIDEIKTRIRENLGNMKKAEIDNDKADQITEKLADAIDFPLPDSLVEREAVGITQQKIQQIINSGSVPADLEAKLDSLQEENEKEAARNLRVFFILQEIGRAEQIAISDQELFAEIYRLAEKAKKNVKTYARELQKEGRIQGIRISLLTAKVLDFLVKEAKITVSAK
ncbi:MAG: trigger factor [Akkermansia sp.]